MKFVWVFNAEDARFPCAVFSSLELGTSWVEQHKLSGVLTAYPLDTSVLEWAVQEQRFVPSKPHHASAHFIGSFTSASQPHHHFTDGVAAA